MSTYAALTDGTNTVTFASPANGGLWYRIESGWGPRVAGLRQSQFGGRGPYDDVQEEIPVSVGGSNAAHMYANVSALKGLLDNANRWYRNEGASATLFKYSPEGATISSAASPLQVATWGAELELPAGWPNIPASGGAVWSSGLTMRFTRKGEWLHNTQAASVSASGGYVGELTFASAASYWSPVDIRTDNIYTASSLTAFVAVAMSAASAIQYAALAAGAFAGDGRWSPTTAASMYQTTNASLARFDPSSTGGGSCVFTTTPIPSLTKGVPYQFVLKAKNNSTTITYGLAVGIRLGASSYSYTPTVYVPTGGSAANPRVYSMGTLIPSYTTTPNMYLYAIPSASAGAGNYLDVDAIYIIDARYGSVYSVRDDNQLGSAGSMTTAQNYLTKPGMSVTASPSAYDMSYSGIVQSLSGASAQVALIATEGSYFRQATGSAASLARSNTWTLTRTNAYLTPV